MAKADRNANRQALEITGQITKGILLGYCDESTAATDGVIKADFYGFSADGTPATGVTGIKGLQQIPDIGGTAETIETTTFNSHAHTFINGLLTYGDSIEFTALHDAAQFVALQGLGSKYWVVGLPDGGDGGASDDYATIKTVAIFKGEVSARINGVGTNEALTDTIAITPSSSIEFKTVAA